MGERGLGFMLLACNSEAAAPCMLGTG